MPSSLHSSKVAGVTHLLFVKIFSPLQLSDIHMVTLPTGTIKQVIILNLNHYRHTPWGTPEKTRPLALELSYNLS